MQRPKFRPHNDLYCVEWGVKLYSLTHSPWPGWSLDGTGCMVLEGDLKANVYQCNMIYIYLNFWFIHTNISIESIILNIMFVSYFLIPRSKVMLRV